MNTDSPKSETGELEMPLGDHLEELRTRILRCLAVLAVAFILAWFFRHPIRQILIRPHILATQAHHIDTRLKYQGYLEDVLAYMKASLLIAAILAAPFWLYQMWAFVAPGLYKKERSVLLRLGAISLLCFIIGIAFGYFVFIPYALRFLLTLSGATTQPMLMIGPYLSLIVLMTLVLGIVFQTPLIMYHLVQWNIISIETVQKHRKTAILLGFVLAAVFTPPDPFTQIMMAVPLILLYDLGALAAAPTRKAFLNFAKFAGTIALVVVLIAGYFLFWPIGTIEAIDGTLKLGDKSLSAGESAQLRHGMVSRTIESSLARIKLGEKTVRLAGQSKLQIHSAGSVSVYSGKLLASVPGRSELQIRSKAARLNLLSGKAEVTVDEDHTITVKVLAGHIRARSEQRDVRVVAGHGETFHYGGTPIEAEKIEDDWKNFESEKSSRTAEPGN
ncbi:MAG: twin-arginine translocase subunit TatC [Planctomycetes bacterium]|nr:twin-arginine translocase subunit TatC [Planctomycetota bacterium]